MNEHTLVSLIALSGFAILALSALRSRRLQPKKLLGLAGTWILIFLSVALLSSILL